MLNESQAEIYDAFNSIKNELFQNRHCTTSDFCLTSETGKYIAEWTADGNIEILDDTAIIKRPEYTDGDKSVELNLKLTGEEGADY